MTVRLKDKVGDIQLSNLEIQDWIETEVKKKCEQKILDLRNKGYVCGFDEFTVAHRPKKFPARILKVIKMAEELDTAVQVRLVHMFSLRYNNNFQTHVEWRVENTDGKTFELCTPAKDSEVSKEIRKNFVDAQRIMTLSLTNQWNAIHGMTKMDMNKGLMPAMSELVDLIVSGKVQV